MDSFYNWIAQKRTTSKNTIRIKTKYIPAFHNLIPKPLEL